MLTGIYVVIWRHKATRSYCHPVRVVGQWRKKGYPIKYEGSLVLLCSADIHAVIGKILVNLNIIFKWECRVSDSGARFLSPILSQVTRHASWPRLRTHVTCGVFCFPFLKLLHMSLEHKSLGLFCNAPYCSLGDELLTSPYISVNSIVTSMNAAP